MNTFFSFVFVIAYFGVFLVGLLTCLKASKSFFNYRYYIKAGSTFSLALLAIGGLIQAILGA